MIAANRATGCLRNDVWVCAGLSCMYLCEAD